MTLQTWNYYDKTEWPERGPWDNEPDKAQWTDEATGLPCLAVRNRLGAWCGYVGVAEGHPAFGKKYDEVDVSTHGGLTFAGYCHEGAPEPAICHIPEPGQPAHVYWLGFDCAHFRDRIPAITPFDMEMRWRFPHREDIYKDFAYVQKEVTALAEQLGALGKDSL